jgi:hypothetical protein
MNSATHRTARTEGTVVDLPDLHFREPTPALAMQRMRRGKTMIPALNENTPPMLPLFGRGDWLPFLFSNTVCDRLLDENTHQAARDHAV